MKDKNCSICLAEFQEQDSKFCDGCKKILHMACIVNSGQAQCPFCRKETDIPEQYKEKFEKKRRELREYINPQPNISIVEAFLSRMVAPHITHISDDIIVMDLRGVRDQFRVMEMLIRNNFFNPPNSDE
jgi:hypothetical protein